MSTQYIGVTDFTNFWQVRLMDDVLHRYRPVTRPDLRLHVGVMMSYKTLNGMPTKWTDAFPGKESIGDIFQSLNVMNCLHYADYTNTNVPSSLERAVGYCGERINALQLDMVWPSPTAIMEGVRRTGMELEVILQVNSQAMQEVGDTPHGVIQRLADYKGIISHVLLDKSMGRGLGMDANALIPYADAIAEHFPELGMTAAGGLGPDSYDLVKPLLKRHPTISVDAQGQLRTSGNALDPIEWERAGEYIRKTCDLM